MLINSGESMTTTHEIKEELRVSLLMFHFRNVDGINKIGEGSLIVDCPKTKHIKSLFSESTSLIKTHNINLTCNINSLWTDTKDTVFLESVDSYDDTYAHAGWESRRNCDGNEI